MKGCERGGGGKEEGPRKENIKGERKDEERGRKIKRGEKEVKVRRG